MTSTLLQPLGPALPGWVERPRPRRVVLEGRYCRLEPLDAARHAADLHAAYSQAPDGRDCTYMFFGPFADRNSYHAFAEEISAGTDPLHYAVIDLHSRRPVGSLALMRIEPRHGVIEVGHVMFSPQHKATTASTEAHYLLMKYVFDELGYRRYEWKCDSLNTPSRRAAARLGFSFEGIFRQAIVYKGRSRDTAWHALLDGDWPAQCERFEEWLRAENFDEQGVQRRALNALRGGTPAG